MRLLPFLLLAASVSSPAEAARQSVGPAKDLFADWLRSVVSVDSSGKLKRVFDSVIHDDVSSADDVWHRLQFPNASDPASLDPSLAGSRLSDPSPQYEAYRLFDRLGYALEPHCANDRANFYYRTIDGSCNWMELHHSDYGQLGTKRARDYDQYSYKDGISEPRDGPNPRAVSNAFFKRKQRIHYEHTPVLLGLIEFIMHDVTYSEDSLTEYIEVPMPEDEETFSNDTVLRVYRTAAVPGTGTSRENPRENANQASTWLDLSALYGSSTDVARALRSFDHGKLKTSPGDYLPFNTMGLPMRTRPGVDARTLFAGGDPRTNEDWILLAVHTLLLRDHNRLCDILAEQHPEYDDEQIYQTVRLIMSAKYALVANSYQMAYWQTSGSDAMPWPRDDGFPLYRQMYGKGPLDINPVHSYPWPLVTKGGKPMVASAEMAVVYRFHEFIVPSIPLKDEQNQTIVEKDLFESAFDANGFVDAGLENVLRGIVAVDIPNFKSGVDEAFRSAGRYRGHKFDIVVSSIVHEREQGLPTFNDYFRAYNDQDPAVVVPIRERFEDFSTDPEMIASLKRLYKNPDEVDLVVGCQLDETFFPGTTVPTSSLIISLFSLFGLGNSDRFSVGYAVMRCILEENPWDCKPSNALEELLWKSRPTKEFPRARWLDPFWLQELDFEAHGANLLWRLITENSEVDCLQRNPLFPFDPETNPVVCAVPKTKQDWRSMAIMVVQVVMALWSQHTALLAVALTAVFLAVKKLRARATRVPLLFGWPMPEAGKPSEPPVMKGWPVLGVALQFQKDPTGLILEGMRRWNGKVFGMKLASQNMFVITQPSDLRAIIRDAPYEKKFSTHEFFRSVNADLIVGSENFENDLHTRLVREHLLDPRTLAGLADTAADASRAFFARHPLVSPNRPQEHFQDLNPYLNTYITYVVSRCMVGPERFDDPRLLQLFQKFNEDAIKTMGLAGILPSWLRWLAQRTITKDFEEMRKILVPVIAKRRAADFRSAQGETNMLDCILSVIDNDNEASDMVGLVAWFGLTNLQATLTSTFFDIVNQPGLQQTVLSSLEDASTSNLSSTRTEPWRVLRSAAFESIRLSGPATGPARLAMSTFWLPSQPMTFIKPAQAVALSSFWLHRSPSVGGPDAAVYRANRFSSEDPDVGGERFVSWGLKTPHLCPGRWFGLQTIQIMVKSLLEEYEFRQDRTMSDEEKYRYSGGFVYRNPVGITVSPRQTREKAGLF